MALDFEKTNVVPGEPVTAQAWNAIVDGLFEVQAILRTGSGTARVAVSGDPRDVDAARVIATDVNGVRYEAVQQIAAGDPFVFPKLTAGAYNITVSAPGCTTGTGAVTINNDGSATPNPVPIALVFSGRRMPNVLGVKWKDAVGPLRTVSARVLDASGKGVPLTGFDPAYNDAPIIMQWPDPDEVMPSGAEPYAILATIIKPVQFIPTPNFVGMTITEAQAAATAAGLILKVV